MEEIESLIKTIQSHRKQNTGTNEIINIIYNQTKNIIERVYPKLFTDKNIILADLEYIYKNKHETFLNGKVVSFIKRDLYDYECLLTALLQDLKLKTFIDKQKVLERYDLILLKCYERIGILFNFYFYFWSCENHYISRIELEKILTFLDKRKDLLNAMFDIYFTVERRSRYNWASNPDEYLINLDDFQIAVHMFGDNVGNLMMNSCDQSLIFEFLNSLKQKLIKTERREIYQSIKEKYPECFFQLKRQLKNLNFNEKYPILSPNGILWLKIIKKLIGLLRASAKEKGVLREKAQSWESEVKDMAPWTNKWLDERFGKKHTIKPQISDGHSDHFIDDITLEDKLLRSNEKLNVDNLIEEKYKKEKRQIKREGILSGFQILLIVDIRDEIKNNKVDAIRIPDCFKIFYEENYWTAVFLFQAFKDTPSVLK
ncbi:MAG: hypothetical protein ACFFAN_01475 [Promethearchaeota archaeon]